MNLKNEVRNLLLDWEGMEEKMKIPRESEIRRLIKINKNIFKDIRDEFENITDILSNTQHLGFKKIKIIDILDYSLSNLKLRSQIFFRDNLNQLKKMLEIQDKDITLYKTKGKEEYRVIGGNNRIFFLKRFPELMDYRNWVWAYIIEIGLDT